MEQHDATEPSLTISRLETDPRIDRLSERLHRLAHKVTAGPRGDLLRGGALGHALHPSMTDLPIGLWSAASLLDLVGGRRARPAARRLIALGLVAAPATTATGLAEYTTITDTGSRRLATVHAAGNTVATGLYALSWLARVRGRFFRGKVLALAGAVVVSGSGYLGGHLAFARQVGQGQRGQGPGPADEHDQEQHRDQHREQQQEPHQPAHEHANP